MESLSSSGLPNWFLKSLVDRHPLLWQLCPTRRISAQQTPHRNCACTKTKGQESSRPLPAWGHGAKHFHCPSPSGRTHTHMSTHWCEGTKGDNPWPWLASARTPHFIVQLFSFSQIIANTHPGFLTHPERLRHLHPWRYPKPDCRWPWASCCRWPCWTRGSLEIPANLTYPTEVLPMQLPPLTTCHYSRGVISAVPPWGTDFFHPAPKAG